MEQTVQSTLLQRAAERQSLSPQLRKLLDTCPGAFCALIATADGFVIAQESTRTVTEKTLAAVTSSIQSLAESMVKESQLESCRSVIIEAEQGYIVSLRINRSRVLTAMGEQPIKLGMLLSSARICVERLTAQLSG